MIEEQIGENVPEYKEVLKLGKTEHLEFISCSYSEKGVHTLTFKTNQNQLLLAEGEVEAEAKWNVDINLQDHGKAIVGLWTGFNKNLESLAIYTAQRKDVAEESIVNRPMLRQMSSVIPDSDFD